MVIKGKLKSFIYFIFFEKTRFFENLFLFVLTFSAWFVSPCMKAANMKILDYWIFFYEVVIPILVNFLDGSELLIFLDSKDQQLLHRIFEFEYW